MINETFLVLDAAARWENQKHVNKLLQMFRYNCKRWGTNRTVRSSADLARRFISNGDKSVPFLPTNPLRRILKALESPCKFKKGDIFYLYSVDAVAGLWTPVAGNVSENKQTNELCTAVYPPSGITVMHALSASWAVCYMLSACQFLAVAGNAVHYNFQWCYFMSSQFFMVFWFKAL
jgi:hypothetical protein